MSATNKAELQSLGAFIRERRLALGFTQLQLAQRLGWVQERISLLENGKYGLPSLPSLADLAGALDVPLAHLLDAAGYPVSPTETGSKDRAGTASEDDNAP